MSPKLGQKLGPYKKNYANAKPSHNQHGDWDAIKEERRPEPKSQAARVIEKFGNARRLAKILTALNPAWYTDASTVYRWTYPYDRGGTNGLIPPRSLDMVMKAAVLEGILLTADDLYPGVR